VLAKALSAVVVILYKYIGWVALQQFVSTASDTAVVMGGVTITPLTAWGRLIGVGDPAPATSAELTINITVLAQIGSIAAYTQLIRTETGIIYLTKTSVALDEATVSVNVVAASGSGSIGNLEVGDKLSFVNSIPYVDRTVTVSAEVSTGADEEETEVYRQRVLDRFQRRPEGGALSDYEAWGEEPAGIVAVYPYTATTPGMIDVYVEATEASSGSADGIPTTAQLEEVLDSINYDSAGLASRRPVLALVNTFPITRTAINAEVTGLNVANTAAVETAIEEALDEYFRGREPYIDGLTPAPRKDRISRNSVGGEIDDIVSANQGTFTTVTLTTGGGGTFEIYTLGAGEKAKLGTVTFA
jgi:uncharacterized phage protein gp47/JayE